MTFAKIGIAKASRPQAPRLVLVTTSLGVLIAQLDTSVVNLALEPIRAQLGVGVGTLQWVVDGYNVVYASLLLTAGTLGDLWGQRLVFAAGVALFAGGSLICGFAPSDALLITGRAVTGLGAACMVPTSLAILALSYPDAKARAHAIAIWASCYGLALAIGPTLGGLLVDAVGWRSIFLLIVPLSAVALGLSTMMPESRDPQGRRLDVAGQALAIVALATMTLAAIEAPQWGTETSLVCAFISLVAGALFLRVEARAKDGLAPLEFLRRGGLPTAMAVASLMTFGMYAMLFLMPLYLQAQRGASAFMAGLELLPLSLTYVLVARRSGRWAARLGPRPMMAAGMASMGAGLFLMAALAPDTRLLFVEAGFALLGLGLGLNTGPVNAVAMASVVPTRSGMASGLLNTARMVGATLGVGLLGALFAAHLRDGSPESFFAGLRAALCVGGAGEVLGAVIAFCCVRRDALSRREAP